MDERDSLMLMRMRRKLMMIKFFLTFKSLNTNYTIAITSLWCSQVFHSIHPLRNKHNMRWLNLSFPSSLFTQLVGFFQNGTREWIELEIATLSLIVSWWLLKCWLPDESWIEMRKERFDYNLRYNWMKQEEMKLVGKRKEVVESSYRSPLSLSLLCCALTTNRVTWCVLYS